MPTCRAAIVSLVSLGLFGCPPSPRGFTRQELLWPEGAPWARGSRGHDTPRIFVYAPDPAVATDTAIVIASGGSYGHHGGLRPEAEPTARWLAAQGITAVIVRYRVGGIIGYDHRAFLADGARAIQIVRARAEELGVAPDRIGMIGYSAGGHLAASLATRCRAPGATSVAVPIDLPEGGLQGVSCRPDFAAAVYPVVTAEPGLAHARSWRNLVGSGRAPADVIAALSVERQVTDGAAPIFIVHSLRDTKVDPGNSVRLHDALVAHDVPTELHLHPDGRHGVGLAADGERMPQMSGWPEAFLAWARRLGKLERTRGDPRLRGTG